MRVGFFAHVWLAVDLVSPQAAFFLLALGGQIILIKADDLGTGWVGRKRAGWISWDGFLPGVEKQGARIVLAARETVVSVRVGREGLGTTHIQAVL